MDWPAWQIKVGDRVIHMPTQAEAIVVEVAHPQIRIQFITLDGSHEMTWVPTESVRPDRSH